MTLKTERIAYGIHITKSKVRKLRMGVKYSKNYRLKYLICKYKSYDLCIKFNVF